MILVKKMLDKVVRFCNDEYGLIEAGADFRFMYFIYFAYINAGNYKLFLKSITIMREAHKDYVENMKEKISFSGFQRGIYRTAEKVFDDVDLLKIIRKVIAKLEG
jgi:hypothetical protein